jgi:hypothetical protein
MRSRCIGRDDSTAQNSQFSKIQSPLCRVVRTMQRNKKNYTWTLSHALKWFETFKIYIGFFI